MSQSSGFGWGFASAAAISKSDVPVVPVVDPLVKRLRGRHQRMDVYPCEIRFTWVVSVQRVDPVFYLPWWASFEHVTAELVDEHEYDTRDHHHHRGDPGKVAIVDTKERDKEDTSDGRRDTHSYAKTVDILWDMTLRPLPVTTSAYHIGTDRNKEAPVAGYRVHVSVPRALTPTSTVSTSTGTSEAVPRDDVLYVKIRFRSLENVFQSTLSYVFHIEPVATRSSTKSASEHDDDDDDSRRQTEYPTRIASTWRLRCKRIHPYWHSFLAHIGTSLHFEAFAPCTVGNAYTSPSVESIDQTSVYGDGIVAQLQEWPLAFFHHAVDAAIIKVANGTDKYSIPFNNTILSTRNTQQLDTQGEVVVTDKKHNKGTTSRYQPTWIHGIDGSHMCMHELHIALKEPRTRGAFPIACGMGPLQILRRNVGYTARTAFQESWMFGSAHEKKQK